MEGRAAGCSCGSGTARSRRAWAASPRAVPCARLLAALPAEPTARDVPCPAAARGPGSSSCAEIDHGGRDARQWQGRRRQHGAATGAAAAGALPSSVSTSPQQQDEVVTKVLLASSDSSSTILMPDEGVALAVQPLQYQVTVAYRAGGRVLQGAQQIWAHVGHSGWRDTRDVELRRASVSHAQEGGNGNGNGNHNGNGNGAALPDTLLWVGTYSIPCASLPVVTHLEVQLAFKGQWPDGRVLWDNNGNRNWATGVELTSEEGLVTYNAAAQSQVAISSLLLRLDALAAKRLVTVEQATMLRTLAWMKDFQLLKAYTQACQSPDEQLAQALRARCSFLRRPGLHVVHIACEMAPIAKVGGLADVVTSLARAHQSMNHLAEIILPKYDCITYDHVLDLRTVAEIQVPWDGELLRTLVWSGVAEGLPVYFLEPHSPHRMFWRGQIYGCVDDVARFLFFSRAALELLAWTGKTPDVLHVHDWQTAAVCPMLKELYRGTSLGRTGSVLTIHNIAFQGRESPALLDVAGLNWAAVYTPQRLRDDTSRSPSGDYDINVLKGGVVYCDRVTTVSPRYAHEVLHTDLGCGLQGPLMQAAKAGRFSGILNGIDVEVWDPSVDPHIARQYSISDCTAGKLACKQALLSKLGLPWDGDVHPSGRPLLVIVSRLTEQKGLPLMLHGVRVALERGAQVVVLGAAPSPAVQQQFVEMQQQWQAGDRARVVLRFDEGLSHQLYAGADMILIPSAFEPCGLTQLIGLRFGTVPVVRETGGLADTVRDVFHGAAPSDAARNGYVFQGSDEASVATAVGRAIDAYFQSWAWWSGTLVPRCMAQDWSWAGRSGQDYLALYRSLCSAYVD